MGKDKVVEVQETEKSLVQPDINNPKDGNKTYAELNS